MVQPIKVMTFGAFDLIHEGHRSLFRQAKKFGGKNSKLYVVVASDFRYKKMKKRSPWFSQTERMRHVSKEKFVDFVVRGDKLNTLKPILKIKPDVIVFGYDQPLPIPELKKQLKKDGFAAKRIIRAKAHKPHIHKSSKIKEKLIAGKRSTKGKTS